MGLVPDAQIIEDRLRALEHRAERIEKALGELADQLEENRQPKAGQS